MVSQTKAFTSLCVLYFVQGIPYGVQIKALPLLLHHSLGFSIETATKTSLLMLPWVFIKPVIAIFAYSNKLSLKLMYGGMFFNVLLNFVLYMLSLQIRTSSNVTSLAYLCIATCFMINVASVCIDIATDHLAIASATSELDLKFLGISNSVQVVAYKLGAMLGGVLLTTVFSNSFMFLSAINLICLFILSATLPGTFKEEKKQTAASSSPKVKFTCNLETFLLLVYLLLYKLGETGANSLFPLLATKLGIQKQTIGVFTSLAFEPLSLFGSICGGYIWTYCKVKRPLRGLFFLLIGTGLSRVLPILLEYFCLLTANCEEYWFMGPAILSFLGGAVSTLTFTLMMSMAHMLQDSESAQYYAVLSSIEVFGKLTFSSFVGKLEVVLGANVFLLCIILTIVSILPLINLYSTLQEKLKNLKNKKE